MTDEELLYKMKNTGFFKHNNYEVLKIDKEEIILKSKITEEEINPYGIGHGGFIFGLGDHLMGMLAVINGRKALTVDANISFINPAVGEYIIAKGKVIKEGKNICYLEATIYNDKNNVVAKMNSRYFYIK